MELEPGDWILLDYGPAPTPSLETSTLPPPKLGWGKCYAKVLSVVGPDQKTPTDLPCLLLIEIGGEPLMCGDKPWYIAIGDVKRKLSPLERLAGGFV